LENNFFSGRFFEIKESNHHPIERIGVEMNITIMNQMEIMPFETCHAQ
jgi:hypothetical protein